MSTTGHNWTKTAFTMQAVLDGNGTLAHVVLIGGTNFYVPMVEATPFPDELTAGQSQTGVQYHVSALSWDAFAPRAPRKGDRITMLGREVLVEDVTLRQVASVPMVYILGVKG